MLGIGLAAGDGVSVGLLAAIFVSNLPEAIGSASGLHAPPRKMIALWVAVAAICTLATVAGFALADNVSGEFQGAANGFAAGALLVMLIDSMIPEAQRKGGNAAGLVTVLGFAVAAASLVSADRFVSVTTHRPHVHRAVCSSLSVRRAGLLLALVTILASSASPAAAHHFPDTCNANNRRPDDHKRPPDRAPGRHASRTRSTRPTRASARATSPRRASTLRLPAADRHARRHHRAARPAAEVAARRDAATAVGAVQYIVAVNPGVPNGDRARSTATGVLHDGTRPTTATHGEDVGTQVDAAGLGFTFTRDPAERPRAVHGHLRVRGHEHQHDQMCRWTRRRSRHARCPHDLRQRRQNANGLLDNAESWRYTCTRLFTPPASTSDRVGDRRTSTIDSETVSPRRRGLGRRRPRTRRRPRRSSSAAAPTLRAARAADGHPHLHAAQRQRRRPAPGHATSRSTTPSARRRPAPPATTCSSAGERWTYTCAQTLATAQTVSGTAVASGLDDLGFNTVSSSNQAGIEVTATARQHPMPTPMPTATRRRRPTPDADTDRRRTVDTR